MDLVFKVPSSLAEADATVNDSNFKEHYPGISGNMSWITLKPYIRQATRDYVLPYVGATTYDAIAVKFQNDDILNATETEFLELLQDTVAYYAVYQALPAQNIVISDMGVQESVGSEGTSVPVGQWRFKNALWKTCLQADSNLDRLLAFMESEVEDGNALFDDWKADDVYGKGFSGFFHHTSELQEIVDIKDSRRTYMALLPHLKRAETGKLTELICPEIVAEIQEQLVANSFTAENAALLPYIREVVANWAVHIGMPSLSVVIENDGFKTVSSSDGMDTKGGVLGAFGKEAVVRLHQQAKRNADDAIARLLKFLYANEDDYPTWKASACYIDPDEVLGPRVACSEDEFGGIAI